MFGSCIVLLNWGLICKTITMLFWTFQHQNLENATKVCKQQIKNCKLEKKLHVNTSKTKHLCGHSYLCARIISDGIP